MLASIGRLLTKLRRSLVSEFGEWLAVLREARTLANDTATYLHDEHAADPKAQVLINRFTTLVAKLERLIPND